MKKLQVWLPLLFAIFLIIGMWIGSGLQKNLPASRNIFASANRSSLQEVVDLVNMKYVDKINADTLTDEAIQAMLTQLDPHSIFIPAVHLSEINEGLQGNFEGIGVEFYIIDDTVHIVNVLSDGPSDKAGLILGDKILQVGDSVVAGNGINGDKIKSLLRGESGSKVAVTVIRAGKNVQTTITRGTIPLPSVDAAYMIAPQTGYIHLNKFSGTTYEEFMRAMETLQKAGMTKLLFDLRGNGGGILTEAVDIADEFLDDNKLIVYTQGDKQDKVNYECKRPGLFEKGKVALLVDENSASASEVVAGALQDWDRATIVGRRTFGKGLVQEQYNLRDGSALRLTVARYYTPIGRNIQKPYDHGRAEYRDELFERLKNGELVHGDSSVEHNGPAYKTKGGRVVYGGGGITPDVFVPYDTSTFSSHIYKVFENNLFSRFIYDYYRKNQPFFNQFKNAQDFADRYTQTAAAWNSLVQYAANDNLDISDVTGKDREEIENRIKSWMARQIFRMNGYYVVANRTDKGVSQALEAVNE